MFLPFHTNERSARRIYLPAAPSPVGITCRLCEREECAQRAFPPVAHALETDENARGVSAYVSASP